MMNNKRLNQLVENINYIVYNYINKVEDNPEEYGLLDKKELLDMVYSQVYNIKASNSGESCIFCTGICDDLRFYTKENIEKLIIEIGEVILK